MSLAFSKSSGLRTGVFFFQLNLVILQASKSGNRYDMIDMSVNGEPAYMEICCQLCVVRSVLSTQSDVHMLVIIMTRTHIVHPFQAT
jgi:hypothetical protein